MVTFNCKITGNGNLKLSEQAQEILDLRPGDEVRVSIHLGDEEIIVPQVYIDDAGIPRRQHAGGLRRERAAYNSGGCR